MTCRKDTFASFLFIRNDLYYITRIFWRLYISRQIASKADEKFPQAVFYSI